MLKIDKRGFTIVELLAVISILSLLIIIVYPTVIDVGTATKKSLKDSKINNIISAAEKYGNENINIYQECVNSSASSYLKSNCAISISRLVSRNYIEGDDTSNNIKDPTTNDNLKGVLLLCYNHDNANVYATYAENLSDIGSCVGTGDDMRCYDCNDVEIHSLDLSSSSYGIAYQQSFPTEGAAGAVSDIITVGDFESIECGFPRGKNGFEVECSIEDNKLKIKYTGVEEAFPYSEFQSVVIEVAGNYKSRDTGAGRRVTKNFTLYITDLIDANAQTLSLTIHPGEKNPNALEDIKLACFQNNIYGCEVTLPTLEVPAGYTFYDYNDEKKTTYEHEKQYGFGEILRLTKTGASGTILTGKELYMNFQPNQYTVYFSPGRSGVSASPSSKIVTFGENYGSLATAGPVSANVNTGSVHQCASDASKQCQTVITGYSLSGWYKSDGTRINAASIYDEPNDITLVGRWSTNTQENVVSSTPTTTGSSGSSKSGGGGSSSSRGTTSYKSNGDGTVTTTVTDGNGNKYTRTSTPKPGSAAAKVASKPAGYASSHKNN